MGMVFIPGIDIKAHALMFRVIDQAVFLADLHSFNGKFQHHLQKLAAHIFICHHRAEHKIIFDRKFL